MSRVCTELGYLSDSFYWLNNVLKQIVCFRIFHITQYIIHTLLHLCCEYIKYLLYTVIPFFLPTNTVILTTLNRKCFWNKLFVSHILYSCKKISAHVVFEYLYLITVYRNMGSTDVLIVLCYIFNNIYHIHVQNAYFQGPDQVQAQVLHIPSLHNGILHDH